MGLINFIIDVHKVLLVQQLVNVYEGELYSRRLNNLKNLSLLNKNQLNRGKGGDNFKASPI